MAGLVDWNAALGALAAAVLMKVALARSDEQVSDDWSVTLIVVLWHWFLLHSSFGATAEHSEPWTDDLKVIVCLAGLLASLASRSSPSCCQTQPLMAPCYPVCSTRPHSWSSSRSCTGCRVSLLHLHSIACDSTRTHFGRWYLSRLQRLCSYGSGLPIWRTHSIARHQLIHHFLSRQQLDWCRIACWSSPLWLCQSVGWSELSFEWLGLLRWLPAALATSSMEERHRLPFDLVSYCRDDYWDWTEARTAFLAGLIALSCRLSSLIQSRDCLGAGLRMYRTSNRCQLPYRLYSGRNHVRTSHHLQVGRSHWFRSLDQLETCCCTETVARRISSCSGWACSGQVEAIGSSTYATCPNPVHTVDKTMELSAGSCSLNA